MACRCSPPKDTTEAQSPIVRVGEGGAVGGGGGRQAKHLTLCGPSPYLLGRMSLYHYHPKVECADSNHGDCGNRCIGKVRSRLSVRGKGQSKVRKGGTLVRIVMFLPWLCAASLYV